MSENLVTRLVVEKTKVAEAREYFQAMQADVFANEPDIVFYSFFQQQDRPEQFWVVEVFKDTKAMEFHLERHAWRVPDFDEILSEPAEFNAVTEL